MGALLNKENERRENRNVGGYGRKIEAVKSQLVDRARTMVRMIEILTVRVRDRRKRGFAADKNERKREKNGDEFLIHKSDHSR